MSNSSILLLIGFTLCLFACSDNDLKPQNTSYKKVSKKKIESINKDAIAIEARQIDNYINRRKLNVITTSTGLRYQVLEKGKGRKVKPNDIVAITYKLYLLDGTLCYQTKKNTLEAFSVNKSEIEYGLHEAIKHLSLGDKAIIIIPSYLAHGLTGDLRKIPPRSTIIYELSVLDIY